MDRFYYIVLWIAYNLMDVVTTHLGFTFGIEEGNFIPARIVALTSPYVLPVYKLGMAGLWLVAVLWLGRRYPRVMLALRLANLLVSSAVVWNTFLILSTLR